MKLQKYLVFVAFVTLFVHAFIDLSRGPLFPELLRDLNIAEKQGGLFFSATSFAMLISSFLASSLLHKYRSIVVILGFMIFLVAGQIMLVNASSLYSLCAAGALLGFAFGGMGVSQNIAVSESSSGSLQRKLFNGLHSMYALSAMLSPIAVSYSIGAGLAWDRFAFGLAVVAGLLLVALLLRFLVVDRSIRRVSKSEKQDESSLGQIENPKFILKVLAASGLAFYVTAELVISLWLVIFLKKQHSFSTEGAGLALGVFFGLLLLGRVVSSFINFKKSNFWLLRTSFLLNIVFIGLGLFVHPLLLSFAGLSMSIVFPVYMSYMAEKYGESLVYVMPYCIGGMSLLVSFAHSLAGYLGENLGLNYSMSLAFFGSVFAILTLLLIEKIIPTKLENQSS